MINFGSARAMFCSIYFEYWRGTSWTFSVFVMSPLDFSSFCNRIPEPYKFVYSPLSLH